MRFLVDAKLPPALARRIEAMGHAAEHVADCGLATAPDPQISRGCDWRSHRNQDEEFVVRRILHSTRGGGLRMGNTRRAALLRRVEAEFPSIVSALERGETLIEVV